jgi:glycogen debranching enzyme
MTQYTRKMARLFDGFRIDNCHSTPMHVASHLLDIGRQVKPDLYVFAELFTGSEEKDILFVSQLGINSLIRESMNAWDAAESSRLVHRHGGQPVGSLTIAPEYFPLSMLGHATTWESPNEVCLLIGVFWSNSSETGHSIQVRIFLTSASRASSV